MVWHYFRSIIMALMLGHLIPGFNSKALAKEQAETFMVYALHSSYKVLAPKKYHPKLSVIVENKTLTSIRGKLVKNDAEVLAHMMIPEGGSKSVEVKIKPNDELSFIPISPPFQKVDLKIGISAYEIPPKRKD